MALNQTTTASSNNGYGPSRAVEGDTGTFWCASSGSFNQWLKVDLGASHTMTSIKQTFADNDGSTFYYKLEGSTNDSSYTTIADHTSTGVGYSTTDNVSGSYRYVRMTVTNITNNHWASSKELEVYGN